MVRGRAMAVDRGGVDEPVGGDREDRPGPGHGSAERRPRLGVAVVLEGVHRAAVADEHRRHGGGHGPRLRAHGPLRRSRPGHEWERQSDVPSGAR